MKNEVEGSDRYVRIPVSALCTVQLKHLVSAKDSSISAPPGVPDCTAVTGITEWVGSWQDETVSVGWDWAVVDGIVVVLSQNEIRTNIQLISPDERPVPRAIGQIHLFHWIETLPWREVAVNDLLRRP